MSLAKNRDIATVAVIGQKDEALPRFVVIRADVFAPVGLEETTVVELRIDSRATGRRSLRRWGKGVDAWFIDLPDRLCREHGLLTGQRVSIELQRASETLPMELTVLIERDGAARSAWDALTAARRRALREHVLAAKRPETRTRRSRLALLGRE